MDDSTFGGADGRLQLCVQSLDRKGKGDLAKIGDRHKVLINRVPKRHRSITAMNFYVAPPPSSQVPPVPPVPTAVATKRPPPRFLEIFEPLKAGDNEGFASSNVSTPSSSKSSLPVTPCSPRRDLVIESHRRDQHSYFPSISPASQDPETTVIEPVQLCPRPTRSDILPSGKRSNGSHWEQEQQACIIEESTRSDRSSQWPMRGESHTNVLALDGTFGRA
ncbi:hypothetical protein CPB86DRAFT_829980 [Serendipita vermifera]|nr:hypothetical protein CPB86DRAFT_829980 [Serendipita vermifera]